MTLVYWDTKTMSEITVSHCCLLSVNVSVKEDHILHIKIYDDRSCPYYVLVCYLDLSQWQFKQKPDLWRFWLQTIANIWTWTMSLTLFYFSCAIQNGCFEDWQSILQCMQICKAHWVGVAFSYDCEVAAVDNSNCIVLVY